jgi:hypothetical protein
VVLWFGLLLFLSISKHYVVVLWLDLSLLLLSVSEHNMWSYYGWVCRCRPSVNTIYSRIMVGFDVVVSQ